MGGGGPAKAELDVANPERGLGGLEHLQREHENGNGLWGTGRDSPGGEEGSTAEVRGPLDPETELPVLPKAPSRHHPSPPVATSLPPSAT